MAKRANNDLHVNYENDRIVITIGGTFKIHVLTRYDVKVHEQQDKYHNNIYQDEGY
jgi:hypothetical protein